jgi:imidazolonepropionase-like amidohydrolase
VVGATLYVGNGQIVSDGTLIIRSGKVERVGPRREIEVPADVRVVPAEGKHVTPGFIDLHSKLFIDRLDLRDYSRTELRSVVDALDLWDPRAGLVEAEGITTVAISPGTSRGAGGLGAVVKLRSPTFADGQESSGWVLSRESHYAAALGVSGETSTSADRLEQYYRLRRLFLEAKKYEKSWEAHWKAVDTYNAAVKKYQPEKTEVEGKKDEAKESPESPSAKSGASEKEPTAGEDSDAQKGEPQKAKDGEQKQAAQESGPKRPKRPKAPSLHVGREALVRAMRGDLPFLVEAHRRDDLGYALRLKEEFGLELAILGGTQGHTLAERIREARVRLAVAPVLLDRRALEYKLHSEANAALLAAADVPVAISSADSSAGEDALAGRHLRLQAIVAVRGGLSRERALRAITLVPARILGLEERIGSLEPGKDADFVIFSGEPFNALSRVEAVAVEGRLRTVPFGSFSEGRVRSRRPAAPQAARAIAPPKAAKAATAGRPLPAFGDGRTVVLRGARVVTPHTGGIRTIARGTIVLRAGRIETVGAVADVSLPADPADIIDLDGKWILPGFFDAHAHIGIAGETDDIAAAISTDLRVLDAFDPWDPEILRFLQCGITAAAISPGHVNVVGGQVAVVKLVPARSQIRVVNPAIALKASLAPQLGLPRFPTAVSGAVRALEEWIRESHQGEALVLLEAPSRAAALRALDLFEGKGSSVALVGGGWHTAETWEMWQPRVPVILGPYGLSDPPFSVRSAAILQRSGTPVLFATEGTRQDLLTTAVLAIRAGLDRDEALIALTARPATLYGLQDRLGSIRAGTDADLVVWSGDPFSLAGRVERVFIDGEQVFVRKTPSAPQRKSRSRI